MFEFHDQDLCNLGDLALSIEPVSRVDANRAVRKGDEVRPKETNTLRVSSKQLAHDCHKGAVRPEMQGLILRSEDPQAVLKSG